jgi:predicted N-acetyltransferase YhbS
MAGLERIGGGGPGPAMPVAMRPFRDAADYWAARELLRRAMVANGLRERSWHVARENRDNPAWYHHIQAAPLYRRDLDIVAVAGDGSVAAFRTAWFDDVSRTAYLEPVATVARHRRRGLARAVILEALHRLQAMGCLVALVGGYGAEANALYGSVMGPDHDVSRPWDLVR